MATIRAKLTVAYAGALLGSVAVYSVALYGERRANARQEIGREVVLQADVALRVLRFAATANEPVTTSTSQVIGAGTQQFVQTLGADHAENRGDPRRAARLRRAYGLDRKGALRVAVGPSAAVPRSDERRL